MRPGSACASRWTPHGWGSLAVPYKRLPALSKIFQDTKWHGGVWSSALKQGPKDIVVRDLEPKYHTLRIAGLPTKCLLIDMQAFDAIAGGDGHAQLEAAE